MPQTTPVKDSVAKIDNDLAVGEDLAFQHRWWRFERAVWIVFLLIVIADILGCFGRGWLARAELSTPDGMMNVHYERVERFSTPSILTIRFGPNAVNRGLIKLWMSETFLKNLGNQRISPQPASSILDRGGVLYSFAASTQPSSVEFALEPAAPGIFPLTIQAAGSAPVLLKIYVMP